MPETDKTNLTLSEQITLASANIHVGVAAFTESFQRKPLAWHKDPVAQALNRYRVEKNAEGHYCELASKHQGTHLATLLTEKADEYRQRAHDAVLEAAEAVKQERAS